MPPEFDAYREWLKIPPPEQPPHHYRLLGLPAFETDSQAIEQAVDRLVIRLQSLSHGPHVKQAQQLLNQVARARLCLTDPQKKNKYDQELRVALHHRASDQANRLEKGAVAERKVQRSQGPLKGIDHPSPATPPQTKPAQTKPAQTKPSQTKPAQAVPSSHAPLHSTLHATPHFSFSKPMTELNSHRSRIRRLVVSAVLLALLGGVTGFLLVQFLLLPLRGSGRADTLAESPPPQSVSRTGQVDEKRNSPPRQLSAKTDDSLDQFAQTFLQELDQPPVGQADSRLPRSTAAVYAPEHPSQFRDLLSTVIQLEGLVIQVISSNSGKTNYILFSKNRGDALPVIVSATDIEIENLKPYVGKKIRVSGPIARRGTEIGIEVKTVDQILIIEVE